MNPEQIAAALEAVPLRTVPEAHTDAPSAAGFYAWWCDKGAVPRGAPAPAHPSAPFGLLYVGIAPASRRSARDLHTRLHDHTEGRIGASTFRRGLVALLWKETGWRPVWATDRVALESHDLAALSAWQQKHLRVQWCQVEEPWTTEPAVIAQMRPPMNLAHNQGNPFYAAMRAARRALDDLPDGRPAAPISQTLDAAQLRAGRAL